MKRFKLQEAILPIILLFTMIGCQSPDKPAAEVPKNGQQLQAVEVIPLQKVKAGSEIVASGHFTTDDETVLSFKTGGIVSSVLVREGDYVRQGQLLATLDITEIQAAVSQAELAQQKAMRDYERANKLYLDSVVTLEQLENSKTGLDVVAQQLKAAKFNLGTTQIRAPKNGYVLRKFVQTGQVAGPGTPILLTNGAGNAQWILKVNVSDKDWGKIKVNDAAKVLLDILPDQPLEGYVAHKMEGADPYSGAFIVEIRLKEKAPATLAAGLFGKAVIYPSVQGQVWDIPYDALLDGHGNQGYVFTTNDEKTAVRSTVTISAIGKDHAEISSGLENASFLIVSGSAYLKDGSAIKVINRAKN